MVFIISARISISRDLWSDCGLKLGLSISFEVENELSLIPLGKDVFVDIKFVDLLAWMYFI
jgi:hypothetical protein